MTGTAIDLSIYGDSVREQAQALVHLLQNEMVEDKVSCADMARTIEAAPRAVRRMANRILCGENV